MAEVLKVYGPPGTGKTTYLINKVEDELKAGVEPTEIIYTSFTRSAAYEARDRALAKFTSYVKSDFPWFSTIHSICFRLLELKREDIFTGPRFTEFCKHYGYDISKSNQDADETTDSDMPSMVLSTVSDYYELFITWMRNLQIDFESAVRQFVGQPGIPDDFNKLDLKLYIDRRNDYKQQTHLFDFTDMIELAIGNALYPLFTKVLISDEMQDASPLLAFILDSWGSRMVRVYQAGDPYQAVYTFMGADPNIFIQTPATSSVTLKQSYRCSAPIHDVSRKLVNRFNIRYPDDDFIPTNQQGFVYKQAAESINWPEFRGNVFYLHRTNWLLSQAYTKLFQDGIPFGTLHGRKAPMQTARAKVVNTLMRLADGNDVLYTDIVKMVEYIPSKTDKENYLKTGVKTVLKQLASSKSGVVVKRRELPEMGFLPDFLKYLNVEAGVHVLKMDADEKRYFDKLIRRYNYGVLNAEPKFTLSTIHGVKGMEADTVILNMALTHRTYDSLIANPEPEHRLFYVGVTRAKTRLIIQEGDDYESYRI